MRGLRFGLRARCNNPAPAPTLTERCVDLVHDVEGRGLVVVQRKHQGQGAQRLFPAAQVADVLPTLFGWAHAEDDTLSSRSGLRECAVGE